MVAASRSKINRAFTRRQHRAADVAGGFCLQVDCLKSFEARLTVAAKSIFDGGIQRQFSLCVLNQNLAKLAPHQRQCNVVGKRLPFFADDSKVRGTRPWDVFEWSHQTTNGRFGFQRTNHKQCRRNSGC